MAPAATAVPPIVPAGMSKADKRQRQRENRAAARARQEREARRRRTTRFAIRAGAVVVVILLAGVIINLLSGDDEVPETTTTVAATTTTLGEATTTTAASTTTVLDDPALESQSDAYREFRGLPVACGAEAPPPPDLVQFDEPEDQGIDPGATVTATVATSCGELVMELDPALAPETVNSFVFLARQGYFDGIVSHRIVPGFVVQTGDPTATGTGGPGYEVPDEFPEEGFAYDRGVVAMAKSSLPDSTGSQWFIAFASTGLPATFNPLGELIEGLDVLERIEAIPAQGERPLEAFYIESVTIDAG